MAEKLIDKEMLSIRQVLSDKVYVAEEEDTGEEMEFVRAEDLLNVFRIADATG